MAMMTTTTMSKTLPTQAYNDDKYNGHAEYRTNEDGAAARNLWSEKRLNKYGTAPHAYGQQSRDNDDADDHRRAATTNHDSLYAQMKFQQKHPCQTSHRALPCGHVHLHCLRVLGTIRRSVP